MKSALDYKNPSFKGIIGVSRKDITPPIGIRTGNWGAARKNVAMGIHLPLTLTCIIFKDNENSQPLVLLTADLGWWKNESDELNLRKGILKELNLDPSQLLFCLSHTHAGPSLSTLERHAPGGDLIEPYLAFLQKQSILAAKEALSTANKSILQWSYGTCNLAMNRDLYQEEEDRDIVGFNPNGFADDTLLVGKVTDKIGKTIATLVNYACHPTTLAWDNELISPDYVGAMRNLIEAHTLAPCIFLQGASGELSPPEQFTGNTDLADRYGRVLGYSVLSALENMLQPGSKLYFDAVVESGAALAIWKTGADSEISNKLSAQIIAIEFQHKEIEKVEELEAKIRQTKDPVLKERLQRKLGIVKKLGTHKNGTPLWIWNLGSTLLIAQPNEAYSYFQQELRKNFPNYAVAIINVANGHIGYLPPENYYEKNTYAVWQTPFAKGSLELLTQEAISASESVIK